MLVWWVSHCHAVQCQHNLFHPYFLRFSPLLYTEFKDSGNACCTSNNHQNLEAFLFVLCKTEYLIRHNTMSSFPSPYFATFLTLPTTLPGWLCWQPIHTVEGFKKKYKVVLQASGLTLAQHLAKEKGFHIKFVSQVFNRPKSWYIQQWDYALCFVYRGDELGNFLIRHSSSQNPKPWARISVILLGVSTETAETF